MRTYQVSHTDFAKISGVICGWAFHRNNGDTHELKFINKSAEKQILEKFKNHNIKFDEVNI